MYAIIKTGSKQYRVAEGDVVDVELLNSDSGNVEFQDILFITNGTETYLGSPNINGWIVLGQVMETVRGPKITSVKYKQRQNQRRKFGHRQSYSRVKITGIVKK